MSRPRRRWLWAIAVLAVLGVIGYVVADFVILPAYSIHKRRELNIQAAFMNATPTEPHIVCEWQSDTGRGEEKWTNLMRGPNAYERVNPKANVYPIFRAALNSDSKRFIVLAWLGAQRDDGFDIEYAVFQPGGRFRASRLLSSGTHAFNGGRSSQSLRIWSATYPEGNRSRFEFDFEIAGVRQTAHATLAGTELAFTIAKP